MKSVVKKDIVFDTDFLVPGMIVEVDGNKGLIVKCSEIRLKIITVTETGVVEEKFIFITEVRSGSVKVEGVL